MISLDWKLCGWSLGTFTQVNTCLPYSQSLYQHVVTDDQSFSCVVCVTEMYSLQQYDAMKKKKKMELGWCVNIYKYLMESIEWKINREG